MSVYKKYKKFFIIIFILGLSGLYSCGGGSSSSSSGPTATIVFNNQTAYTISGIYIAPSTTPTGNFYGSCSSVTGISDNLLSTNLDGINSVTISTSICGSIYRFCYDIVVDPVVFAVGGSDNISCGSTKQVEITN